MHQTASNTQKPIAFYFSAQVSASVSVSFQACCMGFLLGLDLLAAHKTLTMFSDTDVWELHTSFNFF